MVRRAGLLVVLAGLGACPPGTGELLVSAPTRVHDDGSAVRVTVTATTSNGSPGRGSVELTATAGSIEVPSATFADGVAVFAFSCDRATEPACVGSVTLTATWGKVVATRVLAVGAALPLWDAGQVLLIDESQGGGAATAGGGAGGGGGGAGGSASDGGPTPGAFTCDGYDGGVHPGYTFTDGGPLAVGCDGEPIDVAFVDSTSPVRVSVCGTVRLASPAPMPVFPRSLFQGALTLSGSNQLCCGALRCLRDPTRVRYRFDVDPGSTFNFGAGARSDDYSYSQFGYFEGTSASPITDITQGTTLVVDGTVNPMRGVDFGVGPGKRPGDP